MWNSFRSARRGARIGALAALAALAACTSTPTPKFQQEMFDSGASPFSHNFNASNENACEAARRALLSQGYLTTMTRPDTIDATKDFQPNGDSHVTVDFHVVCVAGEDPYSSVVYANAVQSGYALKKSDTSASVGLSVLGSLSLPIRSNSDAMVKVSSETIQSSDFYERFFSFIGKYLRTVVQAAPVPSAKITAHTLPGGPPALATPAPTSAPASASAPAASAALAPQTTSDSLAASSAQPGLSAHAAAQSIMQPVTPPAAQPDGKPTTQPEAHPAAVQPTPTSPPAAAPTSP